MSDRKGEHRDVLEQVRKARLRARARRRDRALARGRPIRLDKKKKHTIDAVVDRLIAKARARASALTDSVETALRTGGGTLIARARARRTRCCREHRACHHCGISFPELDAAALLLQLAAGHVPRLLRPRHAHGDGPGARGARPRALDRTRARSSRGAPSAKRPAGAATSCARSRASSAIDLNKPWSRSPRRSASVILFGTGDERVERQGARARGAAGAFKMRYEGAINSMMRRIRETKSEDMRAALPASSSPDARARPAADGACAPRRSASSSAGRTIAEVSALSVADAYALLRRARRSRAPRRRSPSSCSRRSARASTSCSTSGSATSRSTAPAPSLSGGEGQRIRLASQIGSELTGVIYVLDEPSIGLHQRDNRKLLDALKHLRDIGNTVVVVEHDHETMEEADWLIDFGPGAGRHGGEVVAAGHAGAQVEERRRRASPAATSRGDAARSRCPPSAARATAARSRSSAPARTT